MPKVYNKHHKDAPPDAVYVGRPSKWGNPFVIGGHYGPGPGLTRDEVIEAFRNSVANNNAFIAMVQAELRGKDLVCYCAPKSCHADILLEIANS